MNERRSANDLESSGGFTYYECEYVPIPTLPYLPSQLAGERLYEEDVKESHLLVHLIIIISTRYWLIIITSDSGTEYISQRERVREREPAEVKLLLNKLIRSGSRGGGRGLGQLENPI